MPHRVVIGVGIAGYPLQAAGNTWAFLNWVLGFRAAGWEVWMVEDLASARSIDQQRQPCRPEVSANVAHWRAIVDEFGLGDRATLLLDGASAQLPELLDFARDADLFLNISGHFRVGAVLAAPRRRAYLDLDPAFTQIWAECYQVEMNLAGHDHFFSVGLNLGRAGGAAPTAGCTWLPAGTPVALDYFPADDRPGEVWTTFTHWYGYNPVQYRGEWYGNKSEEFARVLDLPGRTRERLEIATDLHPEDATGARFRAHGWSLLEAAPLNAPWPRYRAYAAASRGEFCVAKNGYVRSRCGWFSDRSAMYLALGRPVILQETGWSEHYPTGEGLFTFSTVEEAAEALDQAGRDPARQACAARALAERYFSAPVVVDGLLRQIGLD